MSGGDLVRLANEVAALEKEAAKWNPWTAPLGEKRPKEPEKGSYEAYVARKKSEGGKPKSKREWERIKKRYKHKMPL